MTGEEIRQVREALNLTQSQFAALLGVHSVTVSRWETGPQSPTPYQIGLIQQFALAAQRKPRTLDEDIATVLVTTGAIAGLYLLLKWAFEVQAQNEPRKPHRRKP